MLPRFFIIMLTVIGLTGWGENCALAGAFIFIEERPPFTSEDRTSKSTAIYLDDGGLVQRYTSEDYQIKELQEASLFVADLFQTLSGISLKSLPSKPESADAMLPPSQAHPGYLRIMVRQSNSAEYHWAGATNAVPSGLQKLVQEALKLATELPARGGSAIGGKTSRLPAGDFVRADVLSADQLAEYRVSPPAGGWKTVKALDDLNPVLKQSLTDPFRLIPVPAGTNPLAAFAVKGEAKQLPLLYSGTGYEIIRYSFLASAELPATCPP